MNDIAKRILSGERRAASRLMRWLDDDDPRGLKTLKVLYPKRNHAFVVGITGIPGAGKSTLINRLIKWYRKNEDAAVGVIAVDPSSPFTGGAILGDRVRMQEHALDEKVFMRSLATRGHTGGLSAATAKILGVFEAMGFDPIFLETVGVGQDEVDVASYAHVTVVVLAPGTGDQIQAIKAGILEAADIIVVNKADRPGAQKAYKDIVTALELNPGENTHSKIVLSVSSATGEGIEELAKLLQDIKKQQQQDSTFKQKVIRRNRQIVQDVLFLEVLEQTRQLMQKDQDILNILDRVEQEEVDPFSAASLIADKILKNNGTKE